MKLLTPKFDIKLDVLDMTPAEAGEVSEVISHMNLRSEWCEPDRRGLVAVIVYFDSPESLEKFQGMIG